MTPTEDEARRNQILDHALDLATEQDSIKAVEYLEGQGDPVFVANLFNRIIGRACYHRKSFPLVILFGRAGIHYALQQAAQCAVTNPEESLELKGRAKAMSYNLGANLWPGWAEEGYALTATDLAIGMDAARINLRLGEELQRGPQPMSNAHWLIGAHHLAARNFESALASFARCVELAEQAQKPESAWMGRGYGGITRMMVAETEAEGKRQWQEAIDSLKGMGTEDATFFAEQLESVAKVFGT